MERNGWLLGIISLLFGLLLCEPVRAQVSGNPACTTYRDTSQNLPSGLFRVCSTGNQFVIDQNTAASGNFSTFTRTSNLITPSVKAVNMVHDNSTPQNWSVFKEDGTPLSVQGTCTNGLQEAINYSRSNKYPLFVYGSGIDPTPTAHARILLTCAPGVVQLAFPAGEEQNYNFYGVDIVCPNGMTADCITFDTVDVTSVRFFGGEIIYPGTAAAVHFQPTNTLNSGGFIGITSSVFKFPAVVVTVNATFAPDPTRGTAIRFTPGANPIIGNMFDVQEIQGGLFQLYVDNPSGSPATGFEQNLIVSPQLHNLGTTSVTVGTSSTNSAHLAANTWRVNINTVQGGATSGISTWGINDLWETTLSGGTGVVLNASASGNLFVIGRNNASTPWTDNSTNKDNVRLDSQQAAFSGKNFLFTQGGGGPFVFGAPSTDVVGQGPVGIPTVTAATTSANSNTIVLTPSNSGFSTINCSKTGSASALPCQIQVGGTAYVTVGTYTSGVLLNVNPTTSAVSVGGALFAGLSNTDVTDFATGQGRVVGQGGVTATNNATNQSLLRMQSFGGPSGFAILGSDATGNGHGQPIAIYMCTGGACNTGLSGGSQIAVFGIRDTNGGGLLIGNSGTVPATGGLTATGAVIFSGLTSAGAQDYVCFNTGTSAVVQGTAPCTASSERYKHDFEPLDAGLDTVLKLPTYSYVRNDHPEIGRQTGLKAEDVYAIDPRLVGLDEEGRPDRVRYDTYTAVLTKAIQDLYREVQVIKEKCGDRCSPN